MDRKEAEGKRRSQSKRTAHRNAGHLQTLDATDFQVQRLFQRCTLSTMHRLAFIVRLSVCFGVVFCVGIVALCVLDYVLSITNARQERTTAERSTESGLILALKAYRTDYGHFPRLRADGCYETAEDNAKLMNALRGLDTTDNTRKIVYYEDRAVKQPNHPRMGFDAKGTLWDPWGNFYRIRVDADGDGKIDNPYKKTHQSVIPVDVIVWTLGKDGVQSESDDEAKGFWHTSTDDVMSWQQ